MSEHDLPRWREILNRALDDESEALSAWEVGFIESMAKQADREGFDPSDKQAKVLDKIEEKLP